MPSIDKQISFMYIEYSTAFHMKYKHLFMDTILDESQIATCPLVITWAAIKMEVEGSNDEYLAISAKSAQYIDEFEVTEEFFEDALQSFFIFPDTDDEDSSKLRLEYVKALLNK